MSGTSRPRVLVRRERKERATASGTYPNSLTACWTLARVAGLTCLAPLMTRDTVTGDTPARLATSLMVGNADSPTPEKFLVLSL